MNFEAMLAPRTEHEFLYNVLGKVAYHVPGDPDKFVGLLPWPTLNKAIPSAVENLQVHKGEDLVPSGAFCTKEADGVARLRVGDMNALLRGGATLTINAIEELSQPISRLFEDLEQKLEVPARAYARVSCGVDTTLKPARQWNDHELIVLQVAGSKSWQVFGGTDKFPTALERPRPPTGDAQWTKKLSSGDLLYLPRGWWHAEQNTNEPAVDLRFGFRNPTGLDLAGRILDRLQGVEFMRMDYPRFSDAKVHSEYLTALQSEIVRACHEPGLVRDFLHDLWRLAPPRTAMSLPWTTKDLLNLSEEHTVVPLARFRRPEVVLDFGDSVEIIQNAESLMVAGAAGKAVSRLFQGSGVKIKDLLQAGAEDQTIKEEILGALSKLLDGGLIALHDAEASPGGRLHAASSWRGGSDTDIITDVVEPA